MIINSIVEGNILTDALFEEISDLDKVVHSVSVKVNQTQISFKHICAKVNGNCVSNPILDIIEYKCINLSIPIHRWKGKDVFLGSTVPPTVEERGGVIQQARAIRLFYFLQDKPEASQWFQQFQDVLSKEMLSRGLKVSRHVTVLIHVVCRCSNQMDSQRMNLQYNIF